MKFFIFILLIFLFFSCHNYQEDFVYEPLPKKDADISSYISSEIDSIKQSKALSFPKNAIKELKKPEKLSKNDSIYIVKKGDSLSRIARRHGLTTKYLVNYNKINPRSILRIGQKITIPSKYAKKKLENRNLSLSGDIYIVQPDDNLWTIAKKSGVSWKQLKKINNLTDTSILRIGQRILLRKGLKVNIVNEKKKPIKKIKDSLIKDSQPSKKLVNTDEPKEKEQNQQISDEEFKRIQKKYISQGYEIWSFAAIEGQTIGDIAKHWDVDKKILLEANPHIKDGVPIKANVKIIIPIKY